MAMPVANIAESAQRLSASLQKKRPVNIAEVRKHVPVLYIGFGKFAPMPDLPDLNSNKRNFLALYSYLANSIAETARRRAGIEKSEMPAFLSFMAEQVRQVDACFYPTPLKRYIADNENSLAVQAAALFIRSTQEQKQDFFSIFKKELSQAGAAAAVLVPSAETEQEQHLLRHAILAAAMVSEFIAGACLGTASP